MRQRFVLTASLAALFVLVIAACGSDSNDGSSGVSSEPLTTAEFVAAADAICADADEKIEALGEPTSEEELGDFLRSGGEIFEEQLNALTALGAPDENAAAAERAFELLAEVNAAAGEAADAFDEGDLTGGQTILEAVDPANAELGELADEIGLEVCGGGA